MIGIIPDVDKHVVRQELAYSSRSFRNAFFQGLIFFHNVILPEGGHLIVQQRFLSPCSTGTDV